MVSLEVLTIKSVAHDFLAPLASIIDGITLLIENSRISSQKEVAELCPLLLDIRERAQRLHDYGKLLLNTSQDPSTCENQQVSLESLCAEIKQNISDTYGAVKLDCKFDVLEIRSCRALTLQVLINLVVNAVRHGGRKDVQIVLNIHKVGERVRFCVSDNGSGIPIQDFGIGLIVVYENVRRMRGAFWIESLPGKGTNAFFELPLN